MKTLSPTAVERIGKMILMLSSDRPGEVGAAAAAIDRTLRVAGADWHDLVGALTAPASRRRRREVVPDEERTLRGLERFVELQRQAVRRHLDRIDELSTALDATKLDFQRTRLVQIIHARGRPSTNLDTPIPLTPTQRKRRAIAELIVAEPSLSDRAIARRLDCSPSTVGGIRRAMGGGPKCRRYTLS